MLVSWLLLAQTCKSAMNAIKNIAEPTLGQTMKVMAVNYYLLVGAKFFKLQKYKFFNYRQSSLSQSLHSSVLLWSFRDSQCQFNAVTVNYGLVPVSLELLVQLQCSADI